MTFDRRCKHSKTGSKQGSKPLYGNLDVNTASTSKHSTVEWRTGPRLVRPNTQLFFFIKKKHVTRLFS